MSPEQYKLLKKISKSEKYDYTNSENSEKNIIIFLAKSGYITYCHDGEKRIPDKYLCSITESGKFFLASIRNEKQKIRKETIFSISALLISLAALVISILSLSTTAPEVWKNIQRLLDFH